MNAPQNERGFTLLEVLVAASLATLILGSLVVAMQRTNSLSDRMLTENEVESRMTRICQTLDYELRSASLGSLTPDLHNPDWTPHNVGEFDRLSNRGNRRPIAAETNPVRARSRRNGQ